jgi:hypothetical protein
LYSRCQKQGQELLPLSPPALHFQRCGRRERRRRRRERKRERRERRRSNRP